MPVIIHTACVLRDMKKGTVKVQRVQKKVWGGYWEGVMVETLPFSQGFCFFLFFSEVLGHIL